MNGGNDACDCAKLIVAGKRVPSARFHDCDYVRARGDYEISLPASSHPMGIFWGRPVGITVAKDGSFLFSEDGNETIWQVSYRK